MLAEGARPYPPYPFLVLNERAHDTTTRIMTSLLVPARFHSAAVTQMERLIVLSVPSAEQYSGAIGAAVDLTATALQAAVMAVFVKWGWNATVGKTRRLGYWQAFAVYFALHVVVTNLTAAAVSALNPPLVDD